MSIRILHLEDNDLDSHLIESTLRQAGVECDLHRVTNRADFVRGLKEHAFDLILADYTLPDFDGLQALELTLNIRPGAPFLFVTGTMGEDVAVDALRRGATDYVVKNKLNTLGNAVLRAMRELAATRQRQKYEQELHHATEVMRDNDKLVTIGRLAATIAHELNNPLEAVTNLIYLIQSDSGLSEDSRAYAQLAEQELRRAVQIATQTLNFYRESAHPADVDVHELIDEVMVLYDRKLKAKTINVERRLDYEGTIHVFPGEIRQVLSNLVANAIDAMDHGGSLAICTRAARKWSDPGVTGMRITIADTGSGMSREVQRQLGRAFFTSKGRNGTGLGVWVTNGIVRKYGGTMRFYSNTQPHRHGTVFSIFLPTTMRPVAVPSRPRVEQMTPEPSNVAV